MNEIYKKYSQQYDRLVNAEDYRKELTKYLLKNIDWNSKVVCEAGIGTGRLTKIYIQKIEKIYGFDREAHMLEQCIKNLKSFEEKIILKIGKNESLPSIPRTADIFIEGWSFGHTIVENNEKIKTTTDKLIKNINNNIFNNGVAIIIETLGTNVDKPEYTNSFLKEFYSILEEIHGFKKAIVKTDYKFTNYKEAAEIMGFFFGEKMERELIECRKEIVPEYTGVWITRNDEK